MSSLFSTSHKDDNTKAIISLGFAGVLALMILVTCVAVATLSSVNTGMSALIESTDQKTSRAYQMRDVIRLRSSEMRSLVQIQDPEERERIFKKLFEYTKTYRENRAALVKLGENDRETEILTHIEEVDARVKLAYDKASDLIYSVVQQPDQLKSVLAEVQLQELVLLNYLNDLVLLEKALAQEKLDANQNTYQQTKKVLTIIVITALGLSLLISGTVTNRVTRANRRIAHLANHDDLTGLHNRRSFEQHLRYTIALAQRGDSTYGLLFLDLDRFKIVNDTCGHHAGDQLLIELTNMVQARLRAGDLFARLGGDEFAIIAQATHFQHITDLAEELRVMVHEYTFQYADQSFKVSLSIGVKPIDGKTPDIESILSDVDSACYVAKQSGRNRVHVTQENDDEVVRYRNDIAGVQSIRRALEEERFCLFQQPVFRITETGTEMEHCEILLRIRSENGELYSPAQFIPLAEKYSLMSEIDRWVFTQVLDWVAAQRNHYDIPRLLINLSGLSFVDEDFQKFVDERLGDGSVDPTRLAFEITETAAVDNLELARKFISRIRKHGCSVALDDFGTGFSTFAYLKGLPINYLKIDGSLVRHLATDTVDREMVRAINDIGHVVGAKTIAEFVEDDLILQHLREMGVDYAQGYGLAKPAPLSALLDYLDDQRDVPMRKAS